MFRLLLVLLAALFSLPFAQAITLHVGASHPYPTIAAAVAAVHAGDTILIHGGTYPGGMYFNNLQGIPGVGPIYLVGAPSEEVIIEGGTNGIQLSDPVYLVISGLIFQHQTGNGLNIDDGGSYDSPASQVYISNCIFRDMNASGNNDLLKLSGLDYFGIAECTFQNGAAGGSGIDMVGCHGGSINSCRFENMGSNSIQCKGGSEWITIERNFFRNGGQRTLNLGGSTGLEFFRPDTAHFEAAHLIVWANVIVGSWAPIAYVGAVNVEVVNNTIYQPENWVVRILQETVDPDRFLECGDNVFVNNLIYFGNSLSTHVNVGPNTRPESFLFSHNLWYNADSPNLSTPDLPVAEAGSVIGLDPLLIDPDAGDFHAEEGSPATLSGSSWMIYSVDYYNTPYGDPRSIGAVALNTVMGTAAAAHDFSGQLFPNPTNGIVYWQGLPEGPVQLRVFDVRGQLMRTETAGPSGQLDLSAAPAGPYWLVFTTAQGQSTGRVVKH